MNCTKYPFKQSLEPDPAVLHHFRCLAREEDSWNGDFKRKCFEDVEGLDGEEDLLG